MAIQDVQRVLDTHIPDAQTKLVMIAIANARNEKTGQCNPSISDLAKATSLSRATVKRRLAELRKDRLIKSETATRNNGGKANNHYKLFPDPLAQSEPMAQPEPTPHGSTVSLAHGSTVSPTYDKPEEQPERGKRPGDKPEVILQTHTDPLTAKAFCDHLKDKGRGLSRNAAYAMVQTLKDIADKGGNPTEALRMTVDRNWTYLKADAYFGTKQREGGIKPPEADWTERIEGYRRAGIWLPAWGPPPGQFGCKAPPELLEDERKRA